jgi:hypothetical protein
MVDVGLFYGHLVYLMAFWSILRPFGIFYGLRFGMLYQEKSGNPVRDVTEFAKICKKILQTFKMKDT